MGYRVGVDVGGTFTDLQLLDEETGQLTEAKVPTTPDDPAVAFGEGLDALLSSSGLAPSELTLVLHGTTVVTNRLLQRKFEPTGLILTKGYRTLLEYARVNVSGAFGTWLFYEPPPRVVPLENVREAIERVDRDGNVRVPLDTDDIAELAGWYSRRGIESVGVSLLWSFVNPAHERQIEQIFREVYPECAVTLSCDVLPEIREFERAITTALSAALRPSVGSYLGHVERFLDERDVSGKLLCMKSSGGVIGTEQAQANPVELGLSGPAAGVLGMAEICKSLGFAKAITLDMGGTSTDISFIADYKPLMSTEGEINEYPLRVPMIDIHTIGAGGGSIAWTSAGGKPQVGPKSAGADPGPAAYGRGGTEATVTDANLVLGRLPTALLSGEVGLDVEASQAAVARFGDSLSLSPIDAALTIVELATHSMELAIREVSTRKGRDPRECVLVAFGGAGPGHAARLAQLLEIPTVLLPHSPGVGSTFGLLSTDIRSDFVQSVLVSVNGAVDGVAAVHEQLATRAWAVLEQEGVREEQRELVASADFRYARQQYSINAEIPNDASDQRALITADDLGRAVESFHAAHRQLCGFDYRDDDMGVEIINLRMAAIGRLARPGTRELASGTEDPSSARVGERSACLDMTGEFVQAPIFDRDKLLAGNIIAGPAIIEEFDSTSLVLEDQVATVDNQGNVVVAIDG